MSEKIALELIGILERAKYSGVLPQLLESSDELAVLKSLLDSSPPKSKKEHL